MLSQTFTVCQRDWLADCETQVAGAGVGPNLISRASKLNRVTIAAGIVNHTQVCRVVDDNIVCQLWHTQ